MALSDEVVTKLINSTNSMAEHMSKQTDTYLWVSIIGVVSGFAIYFFVFYVPLRTHLEFAVKTRSVLRKIVKINQHNVLVMAHRESGLFGSMITMEDIIKIEKLMRKFSKNGKGLDFIMHTFGGELFASMRLALLIKNHPNIHVFIPKYAWSGGSLATLASNDIHMGKLATLSPVDAQLGNLLKMFSAKYWRKVVDQKGKKSNDDTLAMAELSTQILEEQEQFLDELLKDNPNIKREEFIKLFLRGNVTHGKQITPEVLKQLGFNISIITNELYDELIESSKRSGVFGLEWKEKDFYDYFTKSDGKGNQT